ncbi:MAG: methionyl-tRNA formyltransferase [Clostridia bacterium]|nr:methionyl-tRNA formyltransferase [Clostridia bacterium]
MNERIMFFGTPEFAEKILDALITSGENVVAAFTRQDKPKGRGYQMSKPPVKEYAEAHGIPVFQPTSLRNGEAVQTVKSFEPDMIITAAYGLILPPAVLEIPRLGCINVHGSLLPEYRGAAPVQRCIMDGRTVTGVTVMRMDEGCDTGDMIAKAEIPIPDGMNCGGLFDEMGRVGSELLLKVLPRIKAGTAEYEKQDHEKATYAQKIDKSELILDFAKPAKKLHDTVRGVYPYLVCGCVQNGSKGRRGLRVTETAYSDENSGKAPGTVVCTDAKKGIIGVACGTGTLYIKNLIPEGKKAMSAGDYVRGRQIAVNDILSGE